MLGLIVAGAALVLSGGTVIDGYGNAPIPDGIVVIDGERILAVGGVGQVVIPEGAEVVSTEGMTVLPGLWDMQVELMRLGHGDSSRWNETYGPLAERVVMPIAARQLLQAGVTSARDTASPLEAAIRVRGRVREKLIDGPTLYVSGPALRKLAPPRHRRLAVGSERRAGRAGQGAAARERGRRLRAACRRRDVDGRRAGSGGFRGAHPRASGARLCRSPGRCRPWRRGAVRRIPGNEHGDAPFPPEVTQAITGRLTQAGARPLAWTPAISTLLNLESLKADHEPLDDPRTTDQLPELVAADIKGSLASLDRVAASEMPAAKVPTLCDKLRQLDEAKVLLLLGSGGGAPGHLHSRATWQEIDFWVRQCGLPTIRAIRAATHDAATAMGVGHESGAISPGKVADIIAVRGDVLRNPGLLQSVDIVIRKGRRVR